MQLRAAIRYSEYKSAGRLPAGLSLDCAECTEKEHQDRRNCQGYGNPKYKIQIGAMEFYQCPLSLPDQDTWDVIDLILAQEETGIPVSGNCLLDQTRKTFEFRRIILSERIDCQREIQKKMDVEAKQKDRASKASSRRPRGTPVRGR
jgi:hypothetical protein